VGYPSHSESQVRKNADAVPSISAAWQAELEAKTKTVKRKTPNVHDA